MARPTRTRKRASSGRVTTSVDALKNIATLIDGGGQINVGALPPISCAAIANDDDTCLAMLQRRPRETLHDLLVRLDAAIAIAWNEERFIDEINPP